ncbi:hypothetical protein ABZ616_41245 [Streptomyces noursei]|uniref:hypothetical protein n=1 Tax=Streptomyces noursei TaxID=1971 RepID=UPI0033CA04D2
MSKPKRSPGRPAKSAQDKMEQFSIRMPPLRRIELMILARLRKESLSQAVDFAVGQVAQQVKVEEGFSVADAVGRGLQSALGFYVSIHPERGANLSVEEGWSIMNRNPAINEALASPPSLRTAEERYMWEMVRATKDDLVAKKILWSLAEGGALDTILDMAKVGLATGVAPEDVFRKGTFGSMVVKTLEKWKGDMDGLAEQLDEINARKSKG